MLKNAPDLSEVNLEEFSLKYRATRGGG